MVQMVSAFVADGSQGMGRLDTGLDKRRVVVQHPMGSSNRPHT